MGLRCEVTFGELVAGHGVAQTAGPIQVQPPLLFVRRNASSFHVPDAE